MNTLAMIAITVSGVCAVALSMLAPAVVRLLRGFRIRQDALEQQIVALHREMAQISAAAESAALDFKRLREGHAAVVDRVGVIELRGNSRPFDQAIDAARRGDDPAKLAQQFGLSPGEAQLLKVLHGRRPPRLTEVVVRKENLSA